MFGYVFDELIGPVFGYVKYHVWTDSTDVWICVFDELIGPVFGCVFDELIGPIFGCVFDKLIGAEFGYVSLMNW